MNGVRFYADYGSAKARRVATRPHGQTTGKAANPLVLLSGVRSIGGNYSAVVSLTGEVDSPLATGMVCRDYLRLRCRRIPEQLARRWYPQIEPWIDDHSDDDND